MKNSTLTIAEKILISAYVGADRSFEYKHPSEFVLDIHGGEIISVNNLLKQNLWVFPDGSSLIHSDNYIQVGEWEN